jgi:hypothetical protein
MSVQCDIQVLSESVPCSQVSCWNSLMMLRGVLESSQTVIVVTASVKEDERRCQGHTSTSLLHQSATWHRSVNTHLCIVFTWVFFLLLVSFCLQWMAKSSNVSAPSLVWSSANPLPKHLKCFVSEAFGEHSWSRTAVFEWHSRFEASQVSVEDDEHSGWPSTSKMTESVDKFEISSTKTITAEQSMSLQTLVGSVMRFARS